MKKNVMNNYYMSLYTQYKEELKNVPMGNNSKIIELESKMDLINKLCYDLLTDKPQKLFNEQYKSYID